MATQCWYCEKPVSRLRRLAGGIHSECKKEYEANLQQFEGALTEAATSDEIIDDAEVAQLNSLISSGKIRDKDRGRIGLTIYNRLHEQALEDGYITAGEREQLRSLQSYVGIDDRLAESQKLDHLRLLTSMIEGDLPQITPSIILQRKEVAHLETASRWCHLKTRKKRVAGSRAKTVRVTKGVRFRIPATPGHTEEYTELQTVDEGKVVITSKRLVFVGSRKNLNVRLDKVLDLDVHADAVTVHRGTANPTIFMLEDPKMFYAALAGAIQAQSS